MSKWFDPILVLITGLFVVFSCTSCASDSADDSYARALTSLDGGSYERALEQLDRAVQETPEAKALDLVNRIANDTKRYFDKHDYRAEICLYSCALDAARKASGDSGDDSNLGPLYDQLIDAQLDNGEYREAERTLARSLLKKRGNVSELSASSSPDDVVARGRRIVRMGEHLEQLDQHEQARSLYHYGLRVASDGEQGKELWLLARIHADLGSSLKASGQPEDGEMELQSARDLVSKAQCRTNKTGISDDTDESRVRNLLGIDNGSSSKG